MRTYEVLLTEYDAADLVKLVNATCAQYRDKGRLSDIYVCAGRCRLTFKEEVATAA